MTRTVAPDATRDDATATSDASADLRRALMRLRPEVRALVVLRFYLDLSLADVAATLGLPLGTVKSRLHRALAELRADVELEETR
jgi:RNA polymerase sigma-70 factor (ECF subfamily)